MTGEVPTAGRLGAIQAGESKAHARSRFLASMAAGYTIGL